MGSQFFGADISLDVHCFRSRSFFPSGLQHVWEGDWYFSELGGGNGADIIKKCPTQPWHLLQSLTITDPSQYLVIHIRIAVGFVHQRAKLPLHHLWVWFMHLTAKQLCKSFHVHSQHGKKWETHLPSHCLEAHNLGTVGAPRVCPRVCPRACPRAILSFSIPMLQLPWLYGDSHPSPAGALGLCLFLLSCSIQMPVPLCHVGTIALFSANLGPSVQTDAD